jgi:hypothetical protein
VGASSLSPPAMSMLVNTTPPATLPEGVVRKTLRRHDTIFS